MLQEARVRGVCGEASQWVWNTSGFGVAPELVSLSLSNLNVSVVCNLNLVVTSALLEEYQMNSLTSRHVTCVSQSYHVSR